MNSITNIVINVIIILLSIGIGFVFRETHAWSSPKSILKNNNHHRLFHKGDDRSSSSRRSFRRSFSSSFNGSIHNRKPKGAPIVSPILLRPTTSNSDLSGVINVYSHKESFLKYSNLSQDEQKYTNIENTSNDDDDGNHGNHDDAVTADVNCGGEEREVVRGKDSGKKGDDWFGKWFEDSLHDSFVQWKGFIGRGSGSGSGSEGAHKLNFNKQEQKGKSGGSKGRHEVRMNIDIDRSKSNYTVVDGILFFFKRNMYM